MKELLGVTLDKKYKTKLGDKALSKTSIHPIALREIYELLTFTGRYAGGKSINGREFGKIPLLSEIVYERFDRSILEAVGTTIIKVREKGDDNPLRGKFTKRLGTLFSPAFFEARSADQLVKLDKREVKNFPYAGNSWYGACVYSPPPNMSNEIKEEVGNIISKYHGGKNGINIQWELTQDFTSWDVGEFSHKRSCYQRGYSYETVPFRMEETKGRYLAIKVYDEEDNPAGRVWVQVVGEMDDPVGLVFWNGYGFQTSMYASMFSEIFDMPYIEEIDYIAPENQTSVLFVNNEQGFAITNMDKYPNLLSHLESSFPRKRKHLRAHPSIKLWKRPVCSICGSYIHLPDPGERWEFYTDPQDHFIYERVCLDCVERTLHVKDFISGDKLYIDPFDSQESIQRNRTKLSENAAIFCVLEDADTEPQFTLNTIGGVDRHMGKTGISLWEHFTDLGPNEAIIPTLYYGDKDKILSVTVKERTFEVNHGIREKSPQIAYVLKSEALIYDPYKEKLSWLNWRSRIKTKEILLYRCPISGELTPSPEEDIRYSRFTYENEKLLKLVESSVSGLLVSPSVRQLSWEEIVKRYNLKFEKIPTVVDGGSDEFVNLRGIYQALAKAVDDLVNELDEGHHDN